MVQKNAVYFQVQNDRGEWSEMATAQVHIVARIYLPLMLR